VVRWADAQIRTIGTVNAHFQPNFLSGFYGESHDRERLYPQKRGKSLRDHDGNLPGLKRDTKVIPDTTLVRARDWILLAFRHAGHTALTFLTATRIRPPDAPRAEHRPHQGLPLTATAHPDRMACQQFRGLPPRGPRTA
jgi:hypothetical protein